MRNTGKTAVATIVASLGIGAAKLIYDRHNAKHNKSDIKKAYDRLQNNSVKPFRIRHAYENLTEQKQSRVLDVVSLILPHEEDTKTSALDLQVNADDYRRTLVYLTTRWAYRTKIASSDLRIPYTRMKNISIALVKQGLLEHTEDRNNYVRRPMVGRELAMLKPYYHEGIVKPHAYHKALRNIIAFAMYD